MSALSALALLPMTPTAAHAAQASARTASAPSAAALSPERASARARATGTAVRVDGSTTASSTLDADPNGSFTLTQSTAPVRAKVAGAWKSLDATLTRKADGTLSPALAAGSLTLSAGGGGPLAVMRAGTASLALSLPFTLPAPTLSGASATYPGVLPGVDLIVTADTLGGFSEVLAIHDAAAAANPALSSLAFAASATGVTLSADTAGNITALDTHGRALFTAPTPRMWDSATSATAPTTTAPDGTVLDARTGDPAASSPTHPGAHAHTAAFQVAAAPSRLTLIPDQGLLHGSGTVYPLYLDPSYSAGSSSSGQSWTYVSSMYPTTSYYKTTSDSQGLHVGYTDWPSTPAYVSTDSSFYTENVPATIDGATINWAKAYFPETYSATCTTKEPVQLWQTGTISSATTYNNQPPWISQLGSVDAAYGHDSTCPAADVVYDITPTMASAAAGNWANVTLGLKSGTGSDLGWKKFNHIATITTNYDHAPATPTTLSTSPNASLIGNGDVTLYADVYDPDGGSLGVAFTAYVTGNPGEVIASTSYTSTDPTYLAADSGTTAALTIPKATLDADVLSTAYGGSSTNNTLAISWNVTVSDGTLPSDASATQSFTFSTATPGQPTIDDATGITTCAKSTLAYTVGTAASFTFKPNGTTTTPTSYTYQLNGAAPISAPADTHGNATVSLTPTRRTTILTVTAVAASGNLGQVASCPINAAAPSTAAEKDLNGDAVPDLLTVGGTGTGQPAGLWLNQGQTDPGHTTGNGQIASTAADIGADGNGVFGDNAPADFTGAQAITGRFTGDGFQDVLAYYPSGAHAGEAIILNGAGDGSVIQAQDSSNSHDLIAGTFTDGYGTNPLQLVNAYNAAASGYAYPDLIGTAGSSGNYYLQYYPNGNGLYGFGATQPVETYNNTTTTYSNLAPPDSTTTWDAWTLASTQVGGNTDLYLWNKNTGHLYLWANFTVTAATDGTGNYTASYSQYPISTSFDTGASLSTLEAADINSDGTPDLWTVTPAGTATAYLLTNLSASSATLTAQPAQTLVTSSHAWKLNDYSPTTHTAADNTADTSLPMTGTGGVSATTGDLFSPDLALDGTSGHLATTTGAVDLTGSFTVSTWIKPTTTAAGTILSQDGTAYSGLTLGATSSGWQFTLNTGAGTTTSADTLTAGSVQPDVWTHLTAAYDNTAHTMSLYTNDTYTAGTAHTAPATAATGPFQIGANLTAGTRGGYLSGQLAQVQIWNGTALPPGTWGTTTGTATPATTPDLYAANGTIALYQVETDGNLWGANQNTPSGAFGPWQQLSTGGGLTGAPSAVQMPNGVIALYARTSSGQVKGISQSAAGGPFSAPITIGGSSATLTADPTLILLSNGELALYGTGTDGNLWQTTQTSPYGPWSTWTRISTSGTLTGRPSLVQMPNTLINLYARTSTGGLQAAYLTPAGSLLSALTPAATGATLAGDVRILPLSGTRLALYAVGADNNLYGATQTGAYGPYTPFTQLSTSGIFTGQPAALQTPSGQIGLYAHTTANQIQGTSQITPGATPSPFIIIGGTTATITGNPTLLLIINGALTMYAPGPTNTVYGTNQTTLNGPWTTWATM